MSPDRPQPIPNLSGRFHFLDALRGIAACAVAFFHFFTPDVSPLHATLADTLPDWIEALILQGDLGVEVFFVLSGFVIAHSLRNARVGPGYVARFALRRSIRLDPPYWVVLWMIVGFAWLSGPSVWTEALSRWGGWTNLFLNMAYLPDLAGVYRIVWVAWTLCLEVQFYLAFVLLIGASQWMEERLNAYRAPGLILCFAPLALLSPLLWNLEQRYDFFGLWYMFFLGAFAYASLSGRIRQRYFLLYAALILGAALFLDERRGLFAAGTAIAIHTTGVLGGLRVWLQWRPLQYLGSRSYSLYLVHLPVGLLILELWPDASAAFENPALAWTAYSIAICGSLLSAEFLYRLVEQPSMALAHRLRVTGNSATHLREPEPERVSAP